MNKHGRRRPFLSILFSLGVCWIASCGNQSTTLRSGNPDDTSDPGITESSEPSEPGAGQTAPQTIHDENPEDRLSPKPKPNIAYGSVSLREREWHGMNDPNHMVQNPSDDVDFDEAASSWRAQVDATVASERYAIGPPPNGDVGGTYVGGAFSATLDFDGYGLHYRVLEHSYSFSSGCGVNIHHWETGCSGDIFINAPVGSRFHYRLDASGTETLTEGDGSFGYSVGAAVTLESSPLNQHIWDEGLGRSTGPEITGPDGERYSRALPLAVSGARNMSGSNAIGCPIVPWHTSSVNDLVVDLVVEPDCCPYGGDLQDTAWCEKPLAFGYCYEGTSKNNCENYAVNISSGRHPIGAAMGHTPEGTNVIYDCDDLIEKTLQYKLNPVEPMDDGSVPGCPFGQCLGAMYVRESTTIIYDGKSKQTGSDYHFVRRNENGEWTHKVSICQPEPVVGIPKPEHRIPVVVGKGVVNEIGDMEVTGHCRPVPEERATPYVFCSYVCIPCKEEVGNTTSRFKESEFPRGAISSESRPSAEGVTVELLIYSGGTNPIWQVNDEETIEYIYSFLGQRRTEEVEDASGSDLPFGGFYVESSSENHPQRLLVNDDGIVEFSNTGVVFHETGDELVKFLWGKAVDNFGHE